MFEEIGILARLQDACINDTNEHRQELLKTLPHIVVVGSQSVGKTSLLESLIGFDDIFPKGNGTMITRCAVALQLIYARDVEFEAELLNSAEKITTAHTTPASLRNALENHMQGIQEWISNDVLRVKIRSSQTPDLCLMDLPGLIQLPSQDQPKDLDSQIKALVHKYAAAAPNSKAASIILAVTCATNDLANSEALRVARELDPLGERTIGVLTKCDLITDLVSVRQMINSTIHSKFPLKLGYVFIVNRPISVLPGSFQRRLSSKNNQNYASPYGFGDSDSKPALEVTRSATVSGASDGDYFDQEAFRHVRGMCGTVALRDRLKNVLANGIRQFVEERYHQYRNELIEIDLELRNLGPDGSQVETRSFILNLSFKYCRTIEDLLEGKIGEHTDHKPWRTNSASAAPRVRGTCSAHAYKLPATGLDLPDDNSENIRRSSTGAVNEARLELAVPSLPQHELVGGARLNFVFQDWFRPSIMNLDGLDSINDFEIRTAIRNSSGCSSSLFIPESVFETLVRKQIRRLENPVVQCVRQSVKELNALLEQPLQSNMFLELKKYPQLLSKFMDVVHNYVLEREEKCVCYTQDLIRSETAYIDKNHPDFVRDKEKLQEYFIKPPSLQNTQTPIPKAENSHLTPYPLAHPDQPPMGADGCPATFMNFWKKHYLTGSYMKPKASPSNVPPSQSSHMPSNRLCVGETDRALDSLELLDQDAVLIEIIKMLIKSYFAIVKKSLAALVPKVIMHFLVNAIREDMSLKLVDQLYNDTPHGSLLVESDEIADLRRNLKAKERALQDTCIILESLAKKYSPNID